MDDIESQHCATQPVPEAWRPVLAAIVRAFANDDYELVTGIDRVAQPSPKIATQMRDYVANYGETLVELPSATWDTSIAQRLGEDRWEVLVDLWTAESGRSDMVLHVFVDSSAEAPKFEVHLVYVP